MTTDLSSYLSNPDEMELENFSKLDIILDEVYRKTIKLDKDEMERARKLCDKMRVRVEEKLKESKSILHTLENGVTYRGSYFSGVKISKPDEFDLDIQLKLPFNSKQIKISLISDLPGYIKINIRDGYKSMMKIPNWAKKYGDLNKFMDKDGFLVESKIRSELESIFNQHFGTGSVKLMLDDNTNAVVRMKKSGPAFTFRVEVDDLKIDIDFVFVIYFDEEFWPPNPVKKFPFAPRSRKNFWFAVPKPNDDSLSWRLSFPHQEDYFIKGNFNLKHIYRYLKALRDKEGWKLASYHIATLFLWESEREEPGYWKKSEGTLLMHMLGVLETTMKEHAIFFFWDQRCNMIKDWKRETSQNIANRIGAIKRSIINKYNDPDALRSYILSVYHINQTHEDNDWVLLEEKDTPSPSKKGKPVCAFKRGNSTFMSNNYKQKQIDYKCILS